MTPVQIKYASAAELESLANAGHLTEEQKDAIIERLIELLAKEQQ